MKKSIMNSNINLKFLSPKPTEWQVGGTYFQKEAQYLLNKIAAYIFYIIDIYVQLTSYVAHVKRQQNCHEETKAI